MMYVARRVAWRTARVVPRRGGARPIVERPELRGGVSAASLAESAPARGVRAGRKPPRLFQVRMFARRDFCLSRTIRGRVPRRERNPRTEYDARGRGRRARVRARGGDGRTYSERGIETEKRVCHLRK